MGGLRALFMALAVLVVQMPATHAQRAPVRYRPSVGQVGKDAVWVPTPQALVARILTMAKLTSKDFVVDLGSGDGRIVIAAARDFGVRALGIEYDPDMVALSRRNAREAGVAARVKFIQADLFDTDLRHADVVIMYLMPHLLARLRPRLQQLQPGTRLVSLSFGMSDWQPDERVARDGRHAYFWIVPAKVAGDWQLSDERGENIQLALMQQHQFISGLARCEGASVKLRKPALSGAHIRFVIATRWGEKREYVGEVDGDGMRGTFHTASGAGGQWTARRIPDRVVA
jgi:protein-L-isoaspartate O-methyltransferase